MIKAQPFSFSFSSQHSPEEVWEALTLPLSPELNHIVNSPKVNLAYEGLGEDERIDQGTRLVYTPNFPAIGFIQGKLLKIAPDEGTGMVDSVSDDSKTRVDVIEPDQIARGHMEYRVEEGKKDTAVLVVQGEFVIDGMAEAIASVWPRSRGDINKWLIKYGIHNPAERLLENLQEILASGR